MKKRLFVAGILGSIFLSGLFFSGCDLLEIGMENEEKTYTVQFIPGEGSGTPPANQSVQGGTTITLPDQGGMTAPGGKIFNGWETKGATYAAGSSYTVNGDITFTAQWRISGGGPTYTVQYSAGEGSGTPPGNQTVEGGTTITLPSQGSMTAPSGKTFNGWAAGGTAYTAGSSYTVNGNVTFTAQWKSGTSGGPDTPLAEGVYIGILSFDSLTHAITASPVLLDAAGRTALKNAIDSTYTKDANDGTLLYYGVHQALSTMKGLESKLPTNSRSFNIITFTDGLDVGSTDPALWDTAPLDGQNFGGKTDTEYLTWLNTQLESTRIKNNAITASAYGVMGSDVGNQQTFANNLAKLVTASGESSTSIPFSQLSDKFGAIAQSLDVTTTTASFDLKAKPPTQGNGTKIRMTFDTGVTNPDNSQIYFTGTYNYNTGTYTLNDIEYHGITGSVTSVTGTRSGMGPINFHFDNFSLSGGGQVTPSNVQQWIKGPNDANWNRNSEYDQNNTVTSNTTKSSALIYLVLDSSKSLEDNDIVSIRNAVKNFIDVLYDKYYGTNSGNGPDNPGSSTPSPTAAPTNIQAQSLSPDTIRITWSPVSGATVYYIYGSPTEAGSYTYLGSSTAASYTEGYLNPSTTYYFKVLAANEGGEGPLSQSVFATTQTVQTSGTGEIRVYNGSPNWNIVWVGLYDVEGGYYVEDEAFPYDPLPYGDNYYWEEIPAGKSYWVGVEDDYGDIYTSAYFTLSPWQTIEISYDGYGLTLWYN
jgi:hypothetical protein